MEHIAIDPALVRDVGSLGAAVVAYVSKELAANASQHGGATRPGTLTIASSLSVQILLSSVRFNSSAHIADEGGLRHCRTLLNRNSIQWSSAHRDGLNEDTLTFNERLDYREI